MSQQLDAPCQSKIGSMIQSTIGSALGCRAEIAIVLIALIDEATRYSQNNEYDEDILALGQLRHSPIVRLFTGITMFLLHVKRPDGEYIPIFPPDTIPPDFLSMHQVNRPVLVDEYDVILGASVRNAGYVSFVVDNSGSMSPETLAPYLGMYADELRTLSNLADDAVVVRTAPPGERWALWLKDSLSEAAEFARNP